jgi:hypothetical protein
MFFRSVGQKIQQTHANAMAYITHGVNLGIWSASNHVGHSCPKRVSHLQAFVAASSGGVDVAYPAPAVTMHPSAAMRLDTLRRKPIPACYSSCLRAARGYTPLYLISIIDTASGLRDRPSVRDPLPLPRPVTAIGLGAAARRVVGHRGVQLTAILWVLASAVVPSHRMCLSIRR